MIMSSKGALNQITWSGVLVVLFLCVSCSEGGKADDIMTKEQMVKSLMEIYLSEQKITRLALPRDSSERQFERFKQIIFERAGVSDSVFRKSFDYYMDRPKEIEMIYTALVDSLSLMEQRLESSPAAPNK